MKGWGADRALQHWPKPGPEEPRRLASADLQEYDGSWTNIVTNVPLRDAINAARRARKGLRHPPETRVR